MEKIKKAVKAEKGTLVVIGLLFFVAFVYNTLSPYSTDDYAYMYSAVTGERITNIFQIIPSLWDDYLKINGRVAPHFLLQLFLIGPKWIFNLVNAGMYVIMIWLMLNMIECKRANHPFLWLAAGMALWTFVPAYGQVFLWMSGTANYGWCYVFSFIYLKFYISLYFKPEHTMGKKALTGLCIYSFFFGMYSELLSFPVVFISFIFLCLIMYERKEIKKYIGYAIPTVTAAAGYLTMLLSPAAHANHKGELGLGIVFKRLIDVFETYYYLAEILLIIWAVLLVIAVCYSVDKKKIVVSIALFAVNIIAMAMLSVASYAVGRHYANCVVFLITAILVLMQALRDKGKISCVSYCICAYVLVTGIWGLWEGTYDIYSVYRQNIEREAYIFEQRDSTNGEVVVYVPLITSATKYSCKYDLIDMQTTDVEPWPNTAIAKYYGIKEIYGRQ